MQNFAFQTLLVFLIPFSLFSTSNLIAKDSSNAKKPNVVLILVDDLAEADLGYFGNPYHDTPNVDQLFKEGLHFTNGYASAPICSASRAALLTGKTTARLQFEFVTKNKDGRQEMNTRLQSPDYPTNLRLEEKTIAEYLGEAGYQTAYFGKWHLNQHYKKYLGWSPKYGPSKQGFQTAVEDFGSHPYSYFNKKKQREFQPIANGTFPEDSVTNRAVDYLQKNKSSEKPFFLMLSHFYVHTPVHTRSRWLYKKYNKKLPQEIPNRIKRIQYAAFAETMDHYVGQILKAVEKCGLAEETLVVFTSDNGGHPEFSTNKPYRGSKWNLYEGGIRVPFVMRWQGVIHPKQKTDIPVVGYDLLPTICAVAGIEKIHSEVDGKNIFQLLKNDELATSREIVWHFPFYHPETGYKDAKDQIGASDFEVSKTFPHSAIRKGNKKLIHFYENDQTELYDVSDETNDVSQSNPEQTKKLRTRLMGYLKSVNARMAKPKTKAIPQGN